MSGGYNNSKVISSSGRAKAVSTDNIFKIQKGQSVKEGTEEKGVGEEHLSVSHPEKEVNHLQGFQEDYRKGINSSAFEGPDPHKKLMS